MSRKPKIPFLDTSVYIKRPKTTGGIPIKVLEIRTIKDWYLFLYRAKNAPNGMLIETAIISADKVTLRERFIISNKSSFKVIIKSKAVSRILISIIF